MYTYQLMDQQKVEVMVVVLVVALVAALVVVLVAALVVVVVEFEHSTLLEE